MTGGHTVKVVAREINHVGLPQIPDVEVLAAPRQQVPARSFPLSRNYAENLLRNGYWHAESLQLKAAAWLDLLDSCDPDFVICDHAPTAMLAAKQLDVPRAAFGGGFFVPPRSDPMPSIQPWLNLPTDYLAHSEARFLACVNPVMSALGWESLTCVADIFAGAQTFVTTYPECDHYPVRATETYIGPLRDDSGRPEVTWPTGDGPRIFVYLPGRSRQLVSVFTALSRNDCSVVAFVRDADTNRIAVLEAMGVVVVSELVDLGRLAADCDAAVTHGGNGTVAELLRAALPTLIVPFELEHALLAYRLAERGLAHQVNLFDPQPNVAAHVERLLGDPPSNLAQFAARCEAYEAQPAANAIVAACEAFTPHRGRPGTG